MKFLDKPYRNLVLEVGYSHCAEAVWLDRGRQVRRGRTAEATEHYREYREGWLTRVGRER